MGAEDAREPLAVDRSREARMGDPGQGRRGHREPAVGMCGVVEREQAKRIDADGEVGREQAIGPQRRADP